MGIQRSLLDQVKERLQTAQHVVALTGAGMSQESGLPIYRSSPEGLWNQHIASEVASAHALRHDPQKVWEWQCELADKISQAMPNAGHQSLAQLETHCKVTVVTQNVDDLHERAGSSEVIHLHGHIFSYRCVACAHPMTLPSNAPQDWATLRSLVRCAHCNGHIRHDVILFKEQLNPGLITQARKAIRDCDAVLVIGTSNMVYPAAELPRYAMKRQKFVVEINPGETPLSRWVSVQLRAAAAVVLPKIMTTHKLPPHA